MLSILHCVSKLVIKRMLLKALSYNSYAHYHLVHTVSHTCEATVWSCLHTIDYLKMLYVDSSRTQLFSACSIMDLLY